MDQQEPFPQTNDVHPGFEISMEKTKEGGIAIGIFKDGVQQGPGIVLALNAMYQAQMAVLQGQRINIRMPIEAEKVIPTIQ